jgi:hypothetical protein
MVVGIRHGLFQIVLEGGPAFYAAVFKKMRKLFPGFFIFPRCFCSVSGPYIRYIYGEFLEGGSAFV